MENPSNLSPKEQVEYMLQRAKNLEDAKKALDKKEPEKEIEKQEIQLPDLFTPVSGLSLVEDKQETAETILSKFAVDPEDYGSLKLSNEKITKIKKTMGKMTTGASAAVPIICRGDACSYKERCVVGDTQVLLANMNYKAIKDLEVGEKIYTVRNNSLEKQTVKEVVNAGFKSVYKITTHSGKELVCTANHPIAVLTSKGIQWQSLDQGLNEKTKIIVVDDLTEESFEDSFDDLLVDHIISIDYEGVKEVFDITVNNNHNFIANSILIHNCPFFKEDAHILNEPCLVEVYIAEYWTKKYMEDLNIDPNSITELHTVSRLVEISILENRLTQYMSIHQPDLVMDVVTAVDDAGKEIYNKASSIAFEQRERLDKSKLKILESLAATREKKLRIQLSANSVNTQNSYADLRDSLEEVLDSVKNMKNIKTVNLD